ncbi:MAG TPA: hypothetical protein VFM75_12865 [Modicisalibacter sp.]|nr:hypothetical protein [Modicisalibacter sp.]
MSREAKGCWAVAALCIAIMAVAAAMEGGIVGLNCYAYGAGLGSVWAWVLKGVK